MNERIKELAQQAGMYIVDDEFSTYGKFAEKFGKLVHDECIDAVPTDLDPATYSKVLQAIKEHFGFERKMNERIRKFAKQSGFGLDANNIYTAKLEHLPITENMEKFAELIVRECASLAYDGPSGILEHFGVK